MGSRMLNANSNTIDNSAVNVKKPHLLVATVLLTGIASILAIPSAARAECKSYYVSTTGKDSNLGDIDMPWLSIHNAAKKMAPCDTLYVRGGIYNQSGIVLNNIGTAISPVKILAYPNELPILDGSSMNIKQWQAFFSLAGEYIKLSEFELRNGGVGVFVEGSHNTVSNVNAHHMLQNGILARGDYSTVENSTVSWSCMDHYNYLIGKGGTNGWSSGLSAARNTNTAGGIVKHAILRGNTVTENWGEGLSTYEADGTIMENNTVYNNWALNVYISDARNVILKNSLIYNTPNSIINDIGARFPDRFASNLVLADEQPDKPRSTNNIVVNNMMLNGDISAFSWSIPTDGGLFNALIANNTVIDGNIRTGSKNQASVIKNNIFFASKAGFSLADVPSRDGLHMSNNMWSHPPSANASGKGDIIGNPRLVLAGNVGPGKLTKRYFAIGATSPAAGKGSAISGAVNDYGIITNQGRILNIGAYATAAIPIQYLPQQKP